jgi:hypothetical protein
MKFIVIVALQAAEFWVRDKYHNLNTEDVIMCRTAAVLRRGSQMNVEQWRNDD